jgi:hypothetical protein
MGECDLTGFWYPLAQMRRKFEWAGNTLVDTGLLVGPDQLDKPQDQYRSIILPPDPRPVNNPRPSPNVTGYGPVYSEIDRPFGTEEFGTHGYQTTRRLNITGETTPGNWGLTQLIVGGASIPPYVPLKKYEVLEKVSAISGIPIPNQLIDRSVMIAKQNESVFVMTTQPSRGWFMIYNPVNPQAQTRMSEVTPPQSPGGPFIDGSPYGVHGYGMGGYATLPKRTEPSSFVVTWGDINNLIIGPGEAFFCSSQQGLGPCYQGAVAVIGLLPGKEFWAWESGAPQFIWLTDDYGNLITDDYGQSIAASEIGQPAAYFENIGGLLHVYNAFNWPVVKPSGPGVWNKDTFARVGPGSAPLNGAPPVFFGEVTPLELLLLGGNGLPWLDPLKEGQLWNPGSAVGGPIFISTGRPLAGRPYGVLGYGTFGYNKMIPKKV